MDYKTMLALWALYNFEDSKQKRLIILTFILLSLMKKNKIILKHYRDYNKEEIEKTIKEQEQKLQDLLQRQYDEINNMMENILVDAYYSAIELLNKELDVNCSLTLSNVKHLVNETWVGTKNFKQRLAWNLEQVFNKYQELMQKDAEEWEFKKLQENYYYRLCRLIDTELHRDINHACLVVYRLAGIEFVKWIATMDERTCPVCAGRDLKVYPLADAPFCPDHPNCRCLLIPSSLKEYNDGL